MSQLNQVKMITEKIEAISNDFMKARRALIDERAKELGAAIQDHGMTQQDAAEALGVSRARVQQYLAGK